MSKKRFVDPDNRAITAQKFSVTLRDAMKSLELSDADLAVSLGVSKYTVEYWTRSDYTAKIPGDINLTKLCKLLDDEQAGLGRKLRRIAEGKREDLTARTERYDNLPESLDSFVGREKDITLIRDLFLVKRGKVVTLTGPGGVGKTRLAVEVGRALLDDFADGVCFVSLAAAADRLQVEAQIAQELNVREVPDQTLTKHIIETLRMKRLLLVLDNFERVLEAAPLVPELVRECAGLRVLVTSRERLHITGEREYPLELLTMPDTTVMIAGLSIEKARHYEAIRLFEERAENAQSKYELTDKDIKPVVEICIRLDGLPLALELAAARLKFFITPQVLLNNLDKRLKVLTGGEVNQPERHRTLRNALDWSYDLLSEEEKKLFQRLAVFMGGWDEEASKVVCNTPDNLQIGVSEGLSALLDKSLISNKVSRAGGEAVRFQMLETIREYALERLDESGDQTSVRLAHARYFQELACSSEVEQHGQKRGEWLDRLEADIGNFRGALAWCLERTEDANEQVALGVELVSSLDSLWIARGFLSENRQWLEQALSKRNQMHLPTTVWAATLREAGRLADWQGDYPRARTLFEESLTLSREIGDEWEIAASLRDLGNVVEALGDYPRARTLLEESLTLIRVIGDKWDIVTSLLHLGDLADLQRDYPRARTLLEESLTLSREIGNNAWIVLCLRGLGNVAYSQGDYPRAHTLLEESLTLSREIGDEWEIAASLIFLGTLTHLHGDYPGARTLFEESLTLMRVIGDKDGIVPCLVNLGHVAHSQGDYPRARTLLEESLTLSKEIGHNAYTAWSLISLGNVMGWQGDYPRARTLIEEGLALSKEIGYQRGIALSLYNLSRLSMAENNYDVVRRLLAEALHLQRNLGYTVDIAHVLEGMAELELAIGAFKRATALLGVAAKLMVGAGLWLRLEEWVDFARTKEETQRQLGAEGFEEAWQEGMGMGLNEGIEYAIKGT